MMMMFSTKTTKFKDNDNDDDGGGGDDDDQIEFLTTTSSHHHHCDSIENHQMAIIISCLMTFLISLFTVSLILVWMLSNSQLTTTTLNNEPEIIKSSSSSMLILNNNLRQNINGNGHGHVIRINHHKENDDDDRPKKQQLQRNSTLSSYSERKLNEILIEKFPIFHLMNLNNFQFIKKNSNRCQNFSTNNSFLNLVIIIHSAVQNFHHRQIIRETWGHIDSIHFDHHHGHRQQKANIIYVFILGATNSTRLQNRVNEESNVYQDIVQANFLDHYQNLTYKHVASLRWTIEFCYNMDFIMKLDDDAYLNLYTVIESLVNYKNHLINVEHTLRAKNLLACSLFPSNTKPKRRGKWSLSLESYPYETFPPYCSGVGYLMTPDIAFDLYEAAQNAHSFIPIISIDDVYITGLLMEILTPTIQPVPLNSLYIYNVRPLRKWLRKPDDHICPNPYWIGDIGTKPDWEQLIRKLWQKTEIAWQNYRQNNCKI